MSRTVTLDTAGAVTLGATGGQVTFTVPYPQEWHVLRATISVNSTGPVPRFDLYRRFVTPANRIMGTNKGLGDTSDGNEEIFHTGELIIGVWTVGTTGSNPGMPTGATATLALSGSAVLA